MKKALRFASLAAAMAVSSWISMGEQAVAAYPPCFRVHGTFCSTGTVAYCWNGASVVTCPCLGGSRDCGCDYDPGSC
jgi:hypothetical protein